MGLFDTTKTTTTQTNGTTAPLPEQMPYIQQGWAGASDALKQSQAMGQNLPSQLIAQYTPEQLAAFNSQFSYGMGNPQIAAGTAAGGASLLGAGASGAGSGLYGLANFQSGNTPSAVLDAATQYMNNPNTQGMIDAATRDARRAVDENVLTQSNRNAAAAGATNSNRTAIEQGIINRGLADQVGDISSTIRGNAFNTGLQLAQNQLSGIDSNKLNALQALTSGGISAAGAGGGLNSNAVNQQTGLYGLANGAIANQIGAQQAGLDNPLASLALQQQSLWGPLQQYYGIVGNPVGQQTNNNATATEVSSPSTAAGLAGALGSIASIFRSDRRYKRDITKLGELPSGLPFYQFRYIGDTSDTLFIGVMAQDVEKVFPDAVIDIDGIKHVNYDLIG